eukprot:CAMPEP_0198225346 /NCGR_PEP_ID=MMETSP1445-20131203/100845_1 /TAXON_ID=36898 /ORGANISM="Pyramimonas sp., Strain CCMP2087" /LENGTH=99 /DNA_ID=CAMNT_0043904835 /DNA_START=174 /DNA_END=473 /DNA_ORIENTATION=-
MTEKHSNTKGKSTSWPASSCSVAADSTTSSSQSRVLSKTANHFGSEYPRTGRGSMPVLGTRAGTETTDTRVIQTESTRLASKPVPGGHLRTIEIQYTYG